MAAVPVGGGRASPGFETAHQATHQQPSATGVEGAGGTEEPGCGARGRWQGLAGLRNGAPSHTSATKRHRRGGRRRDRRARQRRPRAVAWPGRASRRRAERSSRRGRLAGGPPPTGAPRSPAQQAPGTSAEPQQHGNRHHTNAPRHTKNRHPLSGCRSVVELGGFEPPTFSLRTRRATNCAIAPRTRTA